MEQNGILDQLKLFEKEISKKYSQSPKSDTLASKKLPDPRQSSEILLDNAKPKGFDALKNKPEQKQVPVKKTPYDGVRAEDEKTKGNDFFKKQDYRNAQLHYTKAIQLDPTVSVYYVNRSMAFLKTKQYLEAEKDASRGIELDPKNIKAYWRCGSALKNLGRLEEASSVLKNGLKLDPGNASLVADLKEIDVLIQNESHQKGRPLPIRVIDEAFDISSLSPGDNKQPSLTQPTTANKKSVQKETTTPRASAATDKSTTAVDANEKTKCTNNPKLMDTKPALADTKNKKIDSLLDSSFSQNESKSNVANSTQPFVIKQETTQKTPMIQVIETKPPANKEKEVKPTTQVKTMPASSVKLSVPQSNFEFERDWKTCKSRGGDLLYQYFQNIPPSSFCQLFKSSLESKYFEDILDILSTQFTQKNTPQDIFSVLEGLSAVRRLDMLVMFLSKKQVKDLQSLFEKAKLSNVDPDQIKRVAKKYTINI